MSLIRVSSLVAGAALALTTAVTVAPAAGAQSTSVTEDVEVTYVCQSANASNINNSPNQITVTYPQTVAPGAEFSVTVQPGAMKPNQTRTGRTTYDFAIPENVSGFSAALAGGQVQLGNYSAPQLTRVDATSKTNNAGGTVLRLWGGTSARYGTSTGTSTASGLGQSNANEFRHPAVSMTMRAPLTPDTPIVFGLPGAGAEAANNAANTQFGYVRGTGTSGTQVECAVSENASNLATVTTTDEAPVAAPSTTTISGGDRTLDSSIPHTVQAQVSAPLASSADVSTGTVTFYQVVEGVETEIGSASPAANGTASTTVEFERVPDGEPDRAAQVIARYSGTGADGGLIDGSESAAITVTLTAKPTVVHETNFTVQAFLGGVNDDGQQEVRVRANFNRPATNFYNDEGEPQFPTARLLMDGEEVDSQPMPETGTFVEWSIAVDRGPVPQRRVFTVEYDEYEWDYNVWSGQTTSPASIIVSAQDDTGEIDDSSGSLALGSLNSSALSFGSITGSAETFLLGSIGDRVGMDVSGLSAVLPTASSMLEGIS